MRVAVSGSTGLIGSALVGALERAGHEVTRVVRDPARAGAARRVVFWDPARERVDAAGLDGHDAVVHLAGEPIAGLWTAGKKARIRDSRVRGTALLARTLASLARPPRTLLSASATGYYGHRPPDEPVDETSPPGTGFLAGVAVEWERATEPARAAGIRVVLTRFGLVLSPRGGALVPLLAAVPRGRPPSGSSGSARRACRRA